MVITHMKLRLLKKNLIGKCLTKKQSMFTAKQIDRMSIEGIESLSQMLTEEQRNEWASCGYSGSSYVRITKVKINK